MIARHSAYALLAAIRANQAIGRANEARRLAGEGARRFPSDPVWTQLRGPSPVERLPTAPKISAVQRLMAEGEAKRRDRDLFGALAAYTAAMKLTTTRQSVNPSRAIN